MKSRPNIHPSPFLDLCLAYRGSGPGALILQPNHQLLRLTDFVGCFGCLKLVQIQNHGNLASYVNVSLCCLCDRSDSGVFSDVVSAVKVDLLTLCLLLDGHCCMPLMLCHFRAECLFLLHDGLCSVYCVVERSFSVCASFTLHCCSIVLEWLNVSLCLLKCLE